MSRYAACDWCDREVLLGNPWGQEKTDRWVASEDGDFCDAECAARYRRAREEMRI